MAEWDGRLPALLGGSGYCGFIWPLMMYCAGFLERKSAKNMFQHRVVPGPGGYVTHLSHLRKESCNFESLQLHQVNSSKFKCTDKNSVRTTVALSFLNELVPHQQFRVSSLIIYNQP